MSEEKNVHDPLERVDVVDLLRMGRLDHREGNIQKVSQYQVCLDEGIPGITSPYPIDGPIAEKVNEVDQIYVDFVRSNGRDLEAVADQIMQIYQR